MTASAIIISLNNHKSGSDKNNHEYNKKTREKKSRQNNGNRSRDHNSGPEHLRRSQLQAETLDFTAAANSAKSSVLL